VVWAAEQAQLLTLINFSICRTLFERQAFLLELFNFARSTIQERFMIQTVVMPLSFTFFFFFIE
jgi:hypothetical protein